MDISSATYDEHHHYHHPRPLPPPKVTSIEALESAVQHLVVNFQRRQRWQLLLYFVCCQPQQEAAHYDGDTKKAPWRTHLAHLLESLPAHLATIVLLLLDVTLTVLDLSSSILSCISKKESNRFYHWGGVAILSLLSAKVLALALATGTSFFARPGRVVDGLVVTGALIVEVVAEGKSAGLLVVVSLWRVVRVAESAFELSNEAIEAQIEGVVSQFEVLRGENRRLEEAVAEREERIQELEELLAMLQNTA